MKTLMAATFLLITSASLSAAAGPESDREAAARFGFNNSAIEQPSGENDIRPARVEGGLEGFLKLLFRPGGDIEVTTPSAPAPAVEGELEDETEAETYSPGTAYEPLEDTQEGEGARGAAARGASVSQSQIPRDLLRRAQAYFRANSERISNQNFMAIIDFSQHSSQTRFYIIDLRSGDVRAIRVAHGQGSDPDHDGYATVFSNTPNSHASSLGFYLTGDTYRGSHGSSMRLHGLSSTNSNALDRAIVIHEASYVQEANVRQGRSHGCPAVAAGEIRAVISALQGGALIYAGLANSDI